MATRKRPREGMTAQQRAYEAGAYTPLLKWLRELCERNGKRHGIADPLPREAPAAPVEE